MAVCDKETTNVTWILSEDYSCPDCLRSLKKAERRERLRLWRDSMGNFKQVSPGATGNAPDSQIGRGVEDTSAPRP